MKPVFLLALVLLFICLTAIPLRAQSIDAEACVEVTEGRARGKDNPPDIIVTNSCSQKIYYSFVRWMNLFDDGPTISIGEGVLPANGNRTLQFVWQGRTSLEFFLSNQENRARVRERCTEILSYGQHVFKGINCR